MRTFKVHLIFALISGLTVFAIVNLTAWWMARGHENVCRRQGYTRLKLPYVAQRVREFRTEHGELPARLADIPDLPGNPDAPHGVLRDGWDNPLQYNVSDDFAVYSFGRDGKPGGVGLDADIYHDGRNRDVSLPTLRQFFLTRDRSEVDNGGFVNVGALAGVVVIVTVLGPLRTRERTKAQLSFRQLLSSVLVVMVLSLLIALLLLPLHVPSGH